LHAAKRGWPVFPVRPWSKHPALRQWQHRATCNRDQIIRWWAVAPYNIGIACQPAGLVVIDLDAGHSPPPASWAGLGVTHGRDVLRILADQAGQPDSINTYTVATPHGEHRYFLATPELTLRNSCASLGWGIDTRAAGGLIIAAGSVRRVHGQPRWYRVIRDIDPIALPGWLCTALTRAPAPTQPAIRLLPSSRRRDAYVQAALRGETATVAQAVPGSRAHTLFRCAARLGELVGAGALDEITAIEALLAAAPIASGASQFTRHEAIRHITNGVARGRRNPRPLQLRIT
jgi:hypothetical protein